MTTIEQFHADRLTGVGGSDAGTVAGLNPYKTSMELYLEKTGQCEPDDLSDKPAVGWGVKMEEVIAQHYTEVTGLKLRRNNRLLRSQDHPWMIAHLDREVVGQTDRGVEIKMTDCRLAGKWGEPGTDEVPETHLLQTQHYMGVTGKAYFDIAVLIGGNDFRIYTVQRDDELIEYLAEIEGKFWGHVTERIPPPLDLSHSRAIEVLKKVYPGTNGEAIVLPDEIWNWHNVLQDSQARIKPYKDAADCAKAHILEAMADAAQGILADGTGYTRKVVKRKGYTVEPVEYVDFRFKKGGE
jgi:putative phage-type endonuclease